LIQINARIRRRSILTIDEIIERGGSEMLAKDIMTTNVICVSSDTAVDSIAKTLLDNRITAVPVTDPTGQVLGIVSDADLMEHAVGWPSRHQSAWLMWFQSGPQIAAKIKKAVGQSAKDIMTAPAVTIHPDMPVAQIAEIMAERQLRRVPVVSNGKIVGIVGRANLIHAMGMAADAGSVRPSAQDDKIREQVLAQVGDRNRDGRHRLNVTVSDGIVHLWGVVETEEEREATRLVAESVSGVKEIKNHLTSLDMIPSDVASVV
jgi:CBS domain-containing protein